MPEKSIFSTWANSGLARENPLWGAPWIHGELLKLGIDIGETSVSKYLKRRHKPPSRTWRTFLDNHVKSMVSVDFFTVPTIRFQILYAFLISVHDGLRISAFWRYRLSDRGMDRSATQRGLSLGDGARYLLRDGDPIFGADFVKQVKAMGIKPVLSAPRWPGSEPMSSA
jgi:hypothetical protein